MRERCERKKRQMRASVDHLFSLIQFFHTNSQIRKREEKEIIPMHALSSHELLQQRESQKKLRQGGGPSKLKLESSFDAFQLELIKNANERELKRQKFSKSKLI